MSFLSRSQFPQTTKKSKLVRQGEFYIKVPKKLMYLFINQERPKIELNFFFNNLVISSRLLIFKYSKALDCEKLALGESELNIDPIRS